MIMVSAVTLVQLIFNNIWVIIMIIHRTINLECIRVTEILPYTFGMITKGCPTSLIQITRKREREPEAMDLICIGAIFNPL